MEHYLALLLLVVLLISLTPVITYSICENTALSIERSSSDRCTSVRVTLESVLRVSVPEVKCAVTTGGGECTVFWVERDCVHAVYIADVLVGR